MFLVLKLVFISHINHIHMHTLYVMHMRTYVFLLYVHVNDFLNDVTALINFPKFIIIAINVSRI